MIRACALSSSIVWPAAAAAAAAAAERREQRSAELSAGERLHCDPDLPGRRDQTSGRGSERAPEHRSGGFKCPVCSKSVASNEMEVHFIMCLSKPRLSYNDDVLARDAGECVICLEELQQGDTIARLPCLCIYHKR
ncbi:E3 ubiquitin-protein ligase znrf1 [Nibea albiflora]|uniref:E3 ubiquitin-protein ligase znrf1 n=1 Tax=Nibea albiflora TaxID=240163 RepID=A0ACB7FFW6_NIBAL|nr:E3 ubiquitin-protein ligase znrf1 [Nibea albiflora]